MWPRGVCPQAIAGRSRRRAYSVRRPQGIIAIRSPTVPRSTRVARKGVARLREGLRAARAKQTPGRHHVGVIADDGAADTVVPAANAEAAMDEVVTIEIEVARETAQALRDPRRRQAVGRLVDRMVRAKPGEDPLLEAMGRLGADAKAKGLTPEVLEAELAAHKAERTS
jgi:hypothetical protein